MDFSVTYIYRTSLTTDYHIFRLPKGDRRPDQKTAGVWQGWPVPGSCWMNFAIKYELRLQIEGAWDEGEMYYYSRPAADIYCSGI